MVLFDVYEKQSASLNAKYRWYMGRSRIAVLSKDLGGRKRCSYLGRCLWGCPTDSLYTPSVTLRECMKSEAFEYIDGTFASHFRFDSSGRIQSLITHPVGQPTGPEREIPVGTLVLAAGTLGSAHIFMESIRRDTGEVPVLRGLMDNRQILMPFVNMRMLTRAFDPDSYQYHQLAIGLAGRTAMDYVHGLVTTLKTALVHPIIQSIPFDLKTSLGLFKNMHAALGLVNVNFSDYRRDENQLTLDVDRDGRSRLHIRYEPEPAEAARVKRIARTFRMMLLRLGCVAPPPMSHLRPMGASVHYAGAIPMAVDGGTMTATPGGQSRDFENLYLADGITFPSLPAKNLTFSLMANAARVADHAFG